MDLVEFCLRVPIFDRGRDDAGQLVGGLGIFLKVLRIISGHGADLVLVDMVDRSGRIRGELLQER